MNEDDRPQRFRPSASLFAVAVISGLVAVVLLAAGHSCWGGIAVVLGVVERPADRGGHSLYCSRMYVERDGTVGSIHRKLMPTYDERLAWSPGDGHGLRTHALGPFTAGGLNCWENWMPLVRTSLYAQGEGELTEAEYTAQVEAAAADFEAALLDGKRIRVHVVSRKENRLYWELLKAQGEASGLPVLYNTSFNLFGEPLVSNPRAAVRSFYSSGIDALFVGRFYLEK